MIADVQVVLQCGGSGERLRPLTDTLPKPLIPVGNEPMVERLLRQLVDAGFRRFTVITGHMGDQIQSYLRGVPDLPADMALDFWQETTKRGNVGALADIPRSGRTMLLCFGDLVTELDFAELVDRYESTDAEMLITTHVEEHRLQLGEVEADGVTVNGYFEKPLKKFLICSGIALFESEIVEVLDRQKPAGIVDLVNGAIGAGRRVEHWEHGAAWMDVNSAELLEQANGWLSQA